MISVWVRFRRKGVPTTDTTLRVSVGQTGPRLVREKTGSNLDGRVVPLQWRRSQTGDRGVLEFYYHTETRPESTSTILKDNKEPIIPLVKVFIYKSIPTPCLGEFLTHTKYITTFRNRYHVSCSIVRYRCGEVFLTSLQERETGTYKEMVGER